jgi:hypothetical protein
MQPVGTGSQIGGYGATFALEDWVQHGLTGLRWGDDGNRAHGPIVSAG